MSGVRHCNKRILEKFAFLSSVNRVYQRDGIFRMLSFVFVCLFLKENAHWESGKQFTLNSLNGNILFFHFSVRTRPIIIMVNMFMFCDLNQKAILLRESILKISYFSYKWKVNFIFFSEIRSYIFGHGFLWQEWLSKL